MANGDHDDDEQPSLLNRGVKAVTSRHATILGYLVVAYVTLTNRQQADVTETLVRYNAIILKQQDDAVVFQKEAKAERMALIASLLHIELQTSNTERVAESTKKVVDQTKKAVDAIE